MTLLQSLILGLIQGLTEFLPISSSAHLVLVPTMLNWNIPQAETFIFSVLVQWGTLMAVLIYFWRDLWPIGIAMLKSLRSRKIENAQAKLGWLIILGTIPALILGWLVRDTIQGTFQSAKITGSFLLVTSLLLIFAESVGKRNRKIAELNRVDAIIVGIFQAFSLLPGISRSGASIAGAMARNLTRRSAARFSFLLAVPVMIAAGIVALFQLNSLPSIKEFFPVLFMGFAVSAIVGYFSIDWLIKYLSSRSLYAFAIYCALLGLFAIFVIGA